jgi:hypothetical protein
MANYNTFQENPNKAFTQTVTTTAETNLLTAVGGANLTLQVPQWSKIFDGKSIFVRIAGNFTTDTTTNVTIKMYYSATAAGAKTTQIGTSGAVAANTTSQNFLWMAELLWDSTSAIVNGMQYGNMAGTAIAYAALTNPVTAITDISTPGFWFQPTYTSSAVTATNTVKITDFSLDVN